MAAASAAVGLKLVLHYPALYAVSTEHKIMNSPGKESAFRTPPLTTFRAANRHLTYYNHLRLTSDSPCPWGVPPFSLG